MSTSQGLLDYLPFLSNMFLHGGWLHLILNMWTLYLFGPAVEDRLGSGRYLVFYLACGLFASIAHAFLNPTSTVPALGASGAISGVLGSFIMMFPLARLVIMIPILFFPFFFEVPAILFAGFWFLTQVTAGMAELFMPSQARRYRLVGAYRRLRRRPRPHAPAAPVEAALPHLLRR